MLKTKQEIEPQHESVENMMYGSKPARAIEKNRKVFTSYPSGMATIEEHSLSGSGFALSHLST